MRRAVVFSTVLIAYSVIAFSMSQDVHHSTLYHNCLKFGHLDGKQVKEYFFPRMTPEDINLALRDVRKFIRDEIRTVLRDKNKRVDEHFMINVLNIHGYIIRFIEDARVDLKTKRVFEDISSIRPGTVSLNQYWKMLSERHGVVLHAPKFYARCTDYLVILLRECFSSNSTDSQFVQDVKTKWWYWANKRLLPKLEGDQVFGSYYINQMRLFRELFDRWQDRVDAESAQQQQRYRDNGGQHAQDHR